MEVIWSFHYARLPSLSVYSSFPRFLNSSGFLVVASSFYWSTYLYLYFCIRFPYSKLIFLINIVQKTTVLNLGRGNRNVFHLMITNIILVHKLI